MSILITVDGNPMYGSDYSPKDGYILHEANFDAALNKGGSAHFIVPRENPRFDDFVALRSLVEVYRNGTLRWRGRSLVPERDFYNRKAIVCEGELCFLQDSIQRPRTISGSPTDVFTEIISVHNAAVEDWKKFAVGTVSVAVDNDEISIPLRTGEKTYETMKKLLQYGGYIIFDSLPDGVRRINWLAKPPYTCNQQIKLGYNLLDYSSSGDVTNCATRLIPYGAEQADGSRVQIDNDGVDYVEDAAAVATRGVIEASIVFEDVTDPEELKALALAKLAETCALPETLRLSAADMSVMDLSVDAFQIGQSVTGTSDYHDMSGQYHLISIHEDLLQPSNGNITMTRDAKYIDNASASLTGSISGKDSENKKQFASYLTMVGVITQRLLGAKGGSVRHLDTDGDGLPDTIYVADNPDPAQAVKVWRWNYEGWAASKNGYNGPFVLGATLEDGILASAITAANLIAGTIQSADGGKTLFADLDKSIIRGNFTELSVKGKTVEDIAAGKAEAALDGQTQEDIFNKLTNNGAVQGFYIKDNKLYINAEYVQILNLVAKHFLSTKDTSTLELDGASINLRSGENETFSIDNWEDGIAYMYFRQYDANGNNVGNGQYGARRIHLGGTWAVPVFSISIDDDDSVLVGLSRDENSNLRYLKKLSWKDNGDGTFTLIGT